MAAARWQADFAATDAVLAAAFGGTPPVNPFDPKPAAVELTPDEQKQVSDVAWREMGSALKTIVRQQRGGRPKKG